MCIWETTTAGDHARAHARLKVNDLDGLDASGDRPPRAGAASPRAVRRRWSSSDGFFHADPHPGNFFVEPDGRIAIIDFGMVGAFDDRLRERLSDLLTGVVRTNPDRMAAALVALGASTDPVDRRALRHDLSTLLRRYSGHGVGEIPLGQAVTDLLEITRRHSLRLPPDLALLAKTLIMEEGLAATLDPGFQIVQALVPFARRDLLAQLSPSALLRGLGLAAAGFPATGSACARCSTMGSRCTCVRRTSSPWWAAWSGWQPHCGERPRRRSDQQRGRIGRRRPASSARMAQAAVRRRRRCDGGVGGYAAWRRAGRR